MRRCTDNRAGRGHGNRRPRGLKPGWQVWECVCCGAQRAVKALALCDGWLNYGGGRMCRGCRQRFALLPVGAYADLGQGCRLVKVSEDRTQDEDLERGGAA